MEDRKDGRLLFTIVRSHKLPTLAAVYAWLHVA